MKPIEITEKQWDEIYRSLEKKADEYNRKRKSYDLLSILSGRRMFLSKNPWVCFYAIKRPKAYRTKALAFVEELIHFLPYDCDCRKASMFSPVDMTEWPICLASVYDDEDNLHFYIHVHRVGKCPWKEV